MTLYQTPAMSPTSASTNSQVRSPTSLTLSTKERASWTTATSTILSPVLDWISIGANTVTIVVDPITITSPSPAFNTITVGPTTNPQSTIILTTSKHKGSSNSKLDQYECAPIAMYVQYRLSGALVSAYKQYGFGCIPVAMCTNLVYLVDWQPPAQR
ncbi:hypothetical protein SCAR479_01197 [Seiridium cardinale]|uniref:Uncharacterized protein n=1 Tax=Seiridium cardinale TaxID=138064 RepID=A0ABR2Y801_9PEZI